MGRTAIHFAIRELGLAESADRVAFAEAMTLPATTFYKSMTTYDDHTVWQDVYHVDHNGRLLYVKITLLRDAEADENDGGSLFMMISLKDK